MLPEVTVTTGNMKHPEPAVKPAGDARAARWQGHREARRAELLEATLRAIRRLGPDAGMDEIAAEAGVTKPVLYRHFADKADLYLAVGQRMADEVLTKLGPVLAAAKEQRDAISAVIDTYLAAIASEPELYRFVMRRSFAGTPVAGDPVGDHAELIATALSAVIEERMTVLRLDPAPARAWAHGLVGFVQSTGDWWLREGMTTDRAALTDQLTTLIWDGFAGILARTPEATDDHRSDDH
jgi:AcrR family transcriptional regulator